MYKGKSLAVESKEERQQIFYDVHEGIGNSCKSKAMTSYWRRDSTYELCRERIFWYNMLGDVGEYVGRCQLSQKHGKNAKFDFFRAAKCSCGTLKLWKLWKL